MTPFADCYADIAIRIFCSFRFPSTFCEHTYHDEVLLSGKVRLFSFSVCYDECGGCMCTFIGCFVLADNSPFILRPEIVF